MPNWKHGTPPKDGKPYLVRYKNGDLGVVRWRKGDGYGIEPQSTITAHRSECCGRFGTPEKWMEISGE